MIHMSQVVSGLEARAFVAAQAQPDQVLLEKVAQVSADHSSKTISVKCSPKVSRALQLTKSKLLPEWSHEVVID